MQKTRTSCIDVPNEGSREEFWEGEGAVRVTLMGEARNGPLLVRLKSKKGVKGDVVNEGGGEGPMEKFCSV